MTKAQALAGLTSRWAWVRANTAATLPSPPDAELSEILSRMMISDPVWWVRFNAASALESADDPSLVPALKVALNDSHAWVRGSAVKALGGIDTPEAQELVFQALNHACYQVRVSAVKALGRMDTPRALLLLCRACADPLEGIQEAAMEAIGAIALRRPSLDFSRATWALSQVDTVFDADKAAIKSQALGAITRAGITARGSDLPVPSRPLPPSDSGFPIPSAQITSKDATDE